MIHSWKQRLQFLRLACLGVGFGTWLKRKLPLLDRLVNFDAGVALRDLLIFAFSPTGHTIFAACPAAERRPLPASSRSADVRLWAQR
jgi:hypothetical protein